MKKIRFMDTSFRDGFQSVYGARVKSDDFQPALAAAKEAGCSYFEIGGGAMFQSLYFYCQEDAFEAMDKCRATVGPDVELQTLSRGANVVGLVSQSRDIINLHAKLFKKHGVSTIRNFDALNDVRNLAYSGACIHNAGLNHQVTVTMMGQAPGKESEYAHSSKFYVDSLRKILDAGIPYASVAFKDASGTATPKIIFDTIREARKMLPENITIHMHTHETAGMGVASYMAAIEAGADCVNLAMQPTSGGTCQTDILTMWHRLRGTEYTLDIDVEKIIEAERIFRECMDKYFLPPEACEVSPLIPFSPMPGGALTANTQMMRDNNCLHLYPKVIEEMREVVAKGGFGTSVTPVSQFYFQQAFANVTQGKWKKIADGYGKMVLGYFGHTPAEPDPEIVKLAAEQLKLEPTREDVHDINDRNPALGMKAATAKLEAAGLPVTDENIFIAATCTDKGIEFLKGNKTLGIRYKTDVKTEAKAEAKPSAKAASSESGSYLVTVEGKSFNVHVAPGGATSVAPVQKAPAHAPSGAEFNVASPMPGTVAKILLEEGDSVAEGEEIMVLEAMKMEIPVKAAKAGRILQICVSQGESVVSGADLAVIEELR